MSSPAEPLAIVGISCRLPGGVVDAESFWELLSAGRSGVTEVPPDRWSAARYHSADVAARGKMVTRWGGFVDQLAEFDAEFFGITPREAARMDPQQRWLLELAWEALEDGLVPPATLSDSTTGVFVGLSNSDYGQIQQKFVERIDGYTNSGNSLSIAANRISYQFDLRGPSVAVDTACSSGLVAVSMACQQIWSGACEAALVGAASVIILPDGSLGFSKASMLSPTGRCAAFDARADGYVRSEGAGMIFLKPLARALADGNPVRAVIRSCVVNQDGRTSSMTVPRLDSQRELVEAALAAAGVASDRVGYVEAHGTGTPVGDPIEARALGAALSPGRAPDAPCLIGSAKSNLGHLETAAGLAGIIKAALVLEHRRVPPSLHFSIPNPHIPFDELRLRVATEMTDLPVGEDGRAFVAVNSFGFGGTNAHALLEAAPPFEPPPSVEIVRPLLVPVSARSPAALAEQEIWLRDRIAESPGEVAVAAATGRDHLEHRSVLGGDGEGKIATGRAAVGADARPVFVFTGQGVQWCAMGQGLLEREPVFREAVLEIDVRLQGISLLDELRKAEAASRIHDTEVAQPALFAVQVGLVALWASWGVRPAAVVGHSVGEVAAAHAVGILSLDDAVALVRHRSRLQGTTGGRGRMVVVGLSEEQAHARLVEGVEIAAINGPSLITLAGDTRPLEAVVGGVETDGIFVRWLPIDYAFHTHQMDPIADELRVALRDLEPRDASVPFVSTVDGRELPGAALDAEYWWRNVREPVRFGAVIEALVAEGRRTFLEIGPHPALASAIREGCAARGVSGHILHSLRRETDDSTELARNLAGLHVVGADVDWRAYLPKVAGPRVRLPLYAWQRKSFWQEAPEARRQRVGDLVHPLLGIPVAGPAARWEFLLDPRSFPYLSDHQFWQRIVFPAAGHIEIGLAVGRAQFPDVVFALEEIEIRRVLFVSTGYPPTIRVEFDADDRRYRVFGKRIDDETWTLHATGRVVPQPATPRPPVALGPIRNSLPKHSAHWDCYERFRGDGYDFGPAFQRIEQVWHGPNESLAEVIARPTLVSDGYHFHPVLIDSGFQALLAAAGGGADPDRGGHFLPAVIGRFEFDAAEPPRRFWIHARITATAKERMSGELQFLDGEGMPFGRIVGIELNWVRGQSESATAGDCFYSLEWEDAPELVEVAERPRVRLVDDRGGVAERLAAELGARGVVVTRGAIGEPDDDTVIVDLSALDHPADAALDATRLGEAQATGVNGLLNVARTLQSREMTGRVWCVAGCSAAGVARLASAPVIGFLRVAANELPSVAWTLALLESTDDLPALADRILAGGGESEVAFFCGRTHVRRLRRVRETDLLRRTRSADKLVPFRLENERPGTLERLVVNETARCELAPDEVEVRVQAAGINFRDLMKLLGVYPGEWGENERLGDDFAGVVLGVGVGVTDLRAGDEVVGMAEKCFQSHVVANRGLVFRKPAALSFAEAASLPTVFLTAHHALVEVGRLRAGESILIHAAAGGVGLAAIQVARRLGLEIFATAGSPEKRKLLRGLGIAHVLDSRSLAFAEEIPRITGGRGVDAVLNSLSGEFIPKSLSVLAPFGRFLEIGKVDIFARRMLGLHALRNNATYAVIDVGQLLAERPEGAGGLIEELGRAFTDGVYRPNPVRVFPVGDAAEAFREMSRGGHVGKLVLDFSPEDLVVGRTNDFGRSGAILISGGARGMGFEVAKWLAQNGARNLALLSRSGPGDDAVRAGIEGMQAEGVGVADLRVDVTDANAVAEAVREVEATMGPIVGVVHAAMALDDRFIADFDEASFSSALDPKMLGAWNLHAATSHRELEFFVGFSSFSAVVGSIRQANYAAGNAFLDELARHRRSLGLAALSVNWGAIVGAGFVQRNEKTRTYLESIGIEPFSVDEAMNLLERLLTRDVAGITAARVDWASLLRLLPGLGRRNLYSPVTEVIGRGGAGGSMRALILAVPADQQRRLIEDLIAREVAAVFGADGSSLDRETPVSQLGLDSIMAIELLNRIEGELGIAFPMGSVLNGPSIQQLAGPVLAALRDSEQPEVEG